MTTTACNYQPFSWSAFGRVENIQSWVDELRYAFTNTINADAWRILGRAVMICHPDQDHHLELVRKVATEAEMNLVECTADEFVTWVNEKRLPSEQSPTLVYAPLGDWSAKYGDVSEQPEAIQTFRKCLPNYLAEIDPKFPLVFVTSGSSYAHLDPTLRTVGVFDRRFDVPEPTHVELGNIFLLEVGLPLCDESLSEHAAKVGRLIQIEFNEKRRYRLIALAMQRLAHREKRKLTFNDLVYFSVFGGGEGDTPQETDPKHLNRVAIHEVGHAIVAILDSAGDNLPDYLGIISNDDFHGNVTESFSFDQARYGHYSFRDSCHKIRVALAGRVAESIFLGPENVCSFGARTDLRNAANWAKDLMGKCGFAAAYGNTHPHAINLAVTDSEPTHSEAAYLEGQARDFLAKQYEIVEALIRSNLGLFDAMKEAVLEKRVLTQADISAILNQHPI